METRDLTPATTTAAPQTSAMEEIGTVPPGTPGASLPVPYPQTAPEAVELLAEEVYLARPGPDPADAALTAARASSDGG